jgi:3-hydroxy-3-methylglutaryl CoA synthase
LFSYGSGCGASFCLASNNPDVARYAQQCDPSQQLDNRRMLDVDEYDSILVAMEIIDLNDYESLDPDQWQLNGDLFYAGTSDHQRIYANGATA